MRVPGFFAPLSTSFPDGVDRLENLYREDTGDPDRPFRLVRRPGLNTFAEPSVLNGPVRGMVEINGRCFAVGGTKFGEVDVDGDEGSVASLGTVDLDTRPSMMVSNGTAGDQVAFVSGGKLYTYAMDTETFTGQVLDGDLVSDILGIVQADQYLVAWSRNSRAFQISDILDMTSWASGDVAERSQYYDNIVAIVADQKELLILGEHTGEMWWNSGNADFPFEPIQNAVWRQGCGATHSACLVGDTPYWLGRSDDGAGPIFRLRGGYTPQRISTHWVERKIQQMAVTDDAYAFAFEEGGHRFYVLTFPTESVTLAFDESVDPLVAWSQWSYRNPVTGTQDAIAPRCHVYALGRHLVGSRLDGTIYQQSLEFASDDGEPIRAVRRFRGPLNGGKRVFFGEARLDATVGVGLTTGQGSDPQVMLRKSHDGCRTFGPELWRSLGAMGKYGQSVRWQRMGYADDPGWEVVYTDPVITGLNDFHVDAAGS